MKIIIKRLSILLVTIFILIFITCAIYISNKTQNQSECLCDNMQTQINEIKSSLELIYKEFESHKSESSYINYNDEIVDIYNKINDLYDMIKSEVENKDGGCEDDKQGTSNKDKDTEKEYHDELQPENNHYDKDGDGVYDDMYDMYYGRLYIPELNISVALYYGIDQSIVDGVDSAYIYCFGEQHGFVIGDHNNQEFAKLRNVRVGIVGYIENKYEYIGRINIECTSVFNGHNTGRDLIDEDGVSAIGAADYTMYTCRNNSANVLICLWDIVRR